MAAGDDLSGIIIACAAVMVTLSSLAVGLRFYVRGWLLRAIASEDWCILAAWVFAAVASGVTIKEAKVALGRHMETVAPENFMAYLQATYFKTLFYNLSLCFTKISILLLYLRVLKTFDYLRKAIYITLGIVVVYNVWALGMYLTMCIPIAKMWDPSIAGYCHPLDVWWALTYIHIITDFMIFLLPIPVVLSMTIPRSQKAGLLLVFCVGFFVCLISALRTIWLKALYPRIDLTWDLTSIANWSSAEIHVAIVCACLTTLKPLLNNVFGPMISRFFPRQVRSLEDGLGSRPLTIGSVPLGVLRARGAGIFDHTTVADLGSVGTVTVVRENSTEREDGYQKPELVHISRVTTRTVRDDVEAPPKAHVKE